MEWTLIASSLASAHPLIVSVLQGDSQELSGIKGLGQGVVAASAFRTSYTALSTQADFINSLKVCCIAVG